MKILAIDPGPKESACVLWDGEKILDMGKLPNHEVISVVGARAFKACPQTHLAIEQIVGSYGGNAGMEIMDTAYWTGRFTQRWAGYRGEVNFLLIPRKTVVTHICGIARANDSNVRCALIDRVGPQGTKKAPGPCFGVSKDIGSALAVAVCVHDRLSQGIV